jgi:hypothetical protein
MGLSALSPGPGDGAAQQFQARTALRGELLTFVDQKGMVWFLTTPVAGICSGFGGASGTVSEFTAAVGPASCGPPAPTGSLGVNITFNLDGNEVTLAAWSSAEA